MEMREQILTSAQRLLQERGFNGFSYADVAQEVGIRKASLHHHFPTKTDLGIALVERYASSFGQMLEEIGCTPQPAVKKLSRYVALYRESLEADRMCLCGILAAEALTLDSALLPRLKRFFERNIEWLTEVLASGKSNREIDFSGSAADQSRVFLAMLQGSLLISRATGSRDAFDLSATSLITNLTRKG
jgi:TetR/AcrR family transcriptional regulator, transcriptional repressor for nem operon